MFIWHCPNLDFRRFKLVHDSLDSSSFDLSKIWLWIAFGMPLARLLSMLRIEGSTGRAQSLILLVVPDLMIMSDGEA